VTTRVISLPRARRAAFASAVLALLLTLATALALLTAASAQASVWVISGTARAFPSTPAGARQTIAIVAAGNEYEGVQVALRGGGDHTVTFSWGAGSDPLIVANATLDRVAYVTITRPTTDMHAAPGPYPDPLLPRAFDTALSVPGTTTCFYLLLHVPYGTPGGDYVATLHVVNGTETIDLPVRLHVYSFGWKHLSMHTAFPLNEAAIGRSIQGSGVSFTGAARRQLIDTYYRFMLDHGLEPSPNRVWPSVTSAGHIDAANFAASLAPLLDNSGMGMLDARLPWLNYFPWSQSSYSPSSVRLLTYLTEACHVYAQNGWQKKAYVYILDETITTSEERKAEAYARTLHKASARSGFRCRFLLTDEPRPTSIRGTEKYANKFLYDDVDIWVPRYYYFFGRVPALRERQAHGAQVWWYFYANHMVTTTPSYVIEKSHTEQRVIGWLMQQWRVDGLLNWGFNRWNDALTGTGWRDPYQDPVSYRNRAGLVSNGDTSLIYPGYYPHYGLNNPMAPPVSSLRLEALRDGFEDREYLKLAAKTGPGSAAFVNSVIKTVTWYPYPIRQGNVFDFPKYTTSISTFAAARSRLAQRIEAYLAP
jgi:hypothetical protein